MPAFCNRVFLIGFVGSEPNIYSTQYGSIANFSVATNDYWFDKQTKERRDRTDWHQIVAKGRLGAVVEKYVTKGTQVFIEGALRSGEYENRAGQKVRTYQVEATRLGLLGQEFSGNSYNKPVGSGDFDPPDDPMMM